MKTTSFDVSAADSKLIAAIVTRAAQLMADSGEPLGDRLSLNIDLTAGHANGNPLKLRELLASDNANFSHDVFGISRHIDRTTGRLLDCFLPRFSV